MRKLLCGLLVVSAVVAFPAAVSACSYQMVYGNRWLGVSKGCCEAGGHVNIHVVGRLMCVGTSGVDADDVWLLLRSAIALLVAWVLVLVGFLAGKRRRIGPS